MSEICILFLKQIVLAVANILSMNVQNMYTALEADCSCNGNAPMYVIWGRDAQRANSSNELNVSRMEILASYTTRTEQASQRKA